MSSGLYAEGSGRPELVNLGRAFLVVFLMTVIAGILETIAFSASGCFLSRVVRCFSISRDAIGITLLGLKMWALPALIASAVIVGIGRLRGRVAWWNVLLLAPALYFVLMVSTAKSLDFVGEPEVWVQSAILVVNVQLSLCVGRLFDRLAI
ncbi:hypothetical protein [Bradyrhizobium sp. CCBAU 11386]|uniref:hypothetical protein n=1 Tax=Bradyrhizobium sp. CCBAU 11386 TaxID=1630837 RepID=UPI002304C0B6|nr:hypothetical protein [Bradyrhizobium sp. CCBAU 11386]